MENISELLRWVDNLEEELKPRPKDVDDEDEKDTVDFDRIVQQINDYVVPADYEGINMAMAMREKLSDAAAFLSVRISDLVDAKWYGL